MIGQSVGSDASPLSCFLFRPRKSREKRRKRSHTNVSSTLSTRSSTPPAQMAHVRFHERKWVHTRLSEKDRTQRLTRRNRGVSDGGGITTLGAFRTFTNIPGPGIRKVYFAAFGAWSWVLPKNAESLRDSDALMRVAVPRRRSPAELRDLFASAEVAACTPCAQCFPNVRGMGGITTLGALCVLPKRWMAACQSGLFVVFLASPIYICESPCRILPISALMQVACRSISRGHIACPWLIQA